VVENPVWSRVVSPGDAAFAGTAVSVPATSLSLWDPVDGDGVAERFERRIKT
jgi:hypothetical protein